MTSPWPSPDDPPTRLWLGPLVGWLLVAAALAASASLTGDSTWASGELDGGGAISASQGDLIATPEYQATVGLAYAGLGLATFFGLAAVPWSRATRWVLTGVLAALVVGTVVVTLTVERDSPAEEVVGGFVIVLVPVGLLLVLVWGRLRRASAVAAVVVAAAGAVAHGVTVGRLLGSAGSPALGAWAMAAAVALGLGGAVLVLRTVPSRSALSPARPG